MYVNCLSFCFADVKVTDFVRCVEDEVIALSFKPRSSSFVVCCIYRLHFSTVERSTNLCGLFCNAVNPSQFIVLGDLSFPDFFWTSLQPTFN